MKDNYIKLFIGLILFATWIALVVFKVPDTGEITTAIKFALAGLGVYHLSDSGSPPAQGSKETGFASLAMLLLLSLLAMTLLAGCGAMAQHDGPAAVPSTPSTQVTYTQACAAYGAGFAVALELRRAGKLTRAQVDQVTLIDSQVTPICTGSLPSDPGAAAQQVTAAVTALAILEAVKKGGAQ